MPKLVYSLWLIVNGKRKNPIYHIPYTIYPSGFTLIEVLVSIAIMALVAAVAIPNLRNFSTDQDLENQTGELKSMLRTAKSSANTNIKCANGQTSTSWRVRVTSTNFQLIASCTGSTTETWSTKPFSPSIGYRSSSDSTCGNQLAAEVVFTNNTISFSCNSTPNLATTFNITLENLKNTSSKKSVNITTGGVISD